MTGPAPASEDFGSFGSEWHVPSVFWFVGGTDPEVYAKAKEAIHDGVIPSSLNLAEVERALGHLPAGAAPPGAPAGGASLLLARASSRRRSARHA